MMFPNGQRDIKFPERNEAVVLFLAVLINRQINARGLPVYELGDLAAGIKGLCIGQVIKQLGEIGCHLIRIIRGLLLDLLPPVLIFFYEEGFTQNADFKIWISVTKNACSAEKN